MQPATPVHSRSYVAVNASATVIYGADQVVELTAQAAAVDDPTDREAALPPSDAFSPADASAQGDAFAPVDAFGPEDAPTRLRPPFETAAQNGGDSRPHTVGRGQPTLKLPIASLPVDLAQQAALARGPGRVDRFRSAAEQGTESHGGEGPPRGGPGRVPGGRARIGKYELRDRLGRGAFGVVYTARDPSLDRDVAIKVLRPNHLRNPTIVQRFLQEARATARIAHPGIVTIHDCGKVETKAGPTAFIAMELLFGESLTARLERCGRLPPEAAAEIVRQVASALDAAHRADVLHRDLKPDNIYLVPDPAIPSGERVKVLDFGLAKLGDDGLTNVETVFGTPNYMSPEQCRSATQIDHRSDIYSLGCILFELVTGRVPFQGEVRELIEFHQFAAAPLASSVAPDIPASIDVLIAEMLAKDPMYRPQTMGAVRRALQRGDSEPSSRAPSAPPVELSPRAPEPAFRAELPSGPAIVLDSGMSGELLVPPSGAHGTIAAPSGPRRDNAAPARAGRWQRLGSRARLAGFGLTIALVSALIAWAWTT